MDTGAGRGTEGGGARAFAPRAIAVRADDVELLETPAAFHRRLCEGVAGARRRIVLSSLYFGTRQPLERRLLSLVAAAAARPDGPEILLVLDSLRSTRPVAPSSSSFAADLAAALLAPPRGRRVRVALFHTPLLSSLARRLLPRRFDEIVGVQHAKCCVFDDEAIVSGANLSETYFSTRQDRYARFRSSPELADALAGFCEAVAAHSYALGPDGRPRAGAPARADPVSEPAEFCASLRRALEACMVDAGAGAAPWRARERRATVVYPLAQAGFAGYRQDADAVDDFIAARGAEAPVDCTMASAYLNLSASPWRRSLSRACVRSLACVTASSSSHGFRGAAGVAGLVPYAYSLLERESLESLRAGRRGAADVRLLEYARPGWEWHAKGLWFERGGGGPFAAVVGSSNYGSRSAFRDLELQLLLETRDGGLRARLGEELGRLLGSCVEAHRGAEDARTASALGRLLVRAALPALRRWM